jgi:hypothetical protein
VEVVKNEGRCLYIIKASRYSVVFGEEVNPNYGKYKGTLIDNSDQLKRK